MGLSIAWRLARGGADVTLVDPEPGRGASWAAAGMLAPVTEVHYNEEELLRLNLASQQLYPSFVAELEADSGSAVGYRRCGTLLVARDNDDNAALSDIFAFQEGLGLEVERLRGPEVRALEPGLVSSIRGGIRVEGDHQIDNRALVDALLAACAARGVSLKKDIATEVRPGPGGVEVGLGHGGAVVASQVVVAAGARSGAIGGIRPLPIRPVKGQLLHLRARDGQPVLERNVRGLEVYMVPRSDGRLVVGATVEEQGFDERVTAGAVRDLLDAAFELLPEVIELELVEVAVGHRPGTPDNAPLLGPTDVENVFVATGHHRNGVLLAPVTAELVGALLAGSAPRWDIGPFSPDRFVALEHAS